MVAYTECPFWPCDNEVCTTPQHYHGISVEKAAQIAEIDAEVHNVVITLLGKCVALNRKRNALLPAVNLPQEILVMIFEFACTEKDHGRFSTVLNAEFWRYATWDAHSSPGPLHISRVCSVWREVALATPQLWNTIKLEVYGWADESKAAAALQYWLSNSGQRPLTVALVEDADEVETKYANQNAVIEVLVPYAHRLETAELLMIRNWDAALGRIGKNAVLLKSVALLVPNADYCISDIPFFSGAPELRRIHLQEYSLADALLPLQQIEHLTMEHLDSTVDFVKIISRCPELQHFSLNAEADVEYDSNAPVKFLTHNKLHSLDLDFYYQKNLASRLQGLTLPALRSFKLRSRNRMYQPSPILSPFLANLSSTLESLSLHGHDILEEDLVDCLKALTRLRELTLQYFGNQMMSKNVLLLLTSKDCSTMDLKDGAVVDDRRQVLVPSLTTFSCNADVDDPHLLVEFFASRWDGQHQPREVPEAVESPFQSPTTLAARLLSVAFRSSQIHLGYEDVVAVRRLRREGMHVELANH
ncbi:hypothetical protein BDN70DRAFT_989486 [Pholiota conissans]|uniref:F-box domain-containing protein n=1 Tax=Pholiota conissans TaxID=109636 RepID=A0A9P6D5J5_9AGAR|nr:hypothetical protein BDN70DRAFT_989486 [Pholiota conissans]